MSNSINSRITTYLAKARVKNFQSTQFQATKLVINLTDITAKFIANKLVLVVLEKLI